MTPGVEVLNPLHRLVGPGYPCPSCHSGSTPRGTATPDRFSADLAEALAVYDDPPAEFDFESTPPGFSAPTGIPPALAAVIHRLWGSRVISPLLADIFPALRGLSDPAQVLEACLVFGDGDFDIEAARAAAPTPSPAFLSRLAEDTELVVRQGLRATFRARSATLAASQDVINRPFIETLSLRALPVRLRLGAHSREMRPPRQRARGCNGPVLRGVPLASRRLGRSLPSGCAPLSTTVGRRPQYAAVAARPQPSIGLRASIYNIVAQSWSPPTHSSRLRAT